MNPASDPGDRRPVARFGPDRRIALGAAALAVLAAGAAALSGDPQGRLLAGVAAALLAAVAVADLLFWPRLTASADGLTLHTPSVRAHLDWGEIEAIRVDERNRFGLASRTLEIDAGPRLVVLSRWALGGDPRDVLDLVTAFDPR